MNGLITPWN